MIADDWILFMLLVCGFILCLFVGVLIAAYAEAGRQFDNAHRNSAGRKAMARDVWK